MAPTKFAKLLKVVLPIVQGGAAGATGGNWRVPGSGFEAAGNMFARQREFGLQQNELALRRQMLQRQLYDDQYRNALEAARTREAEAQGRRYDELANAQTKVKPQIEDTDAGLMVVDLERAQARPVVNMAPEETGSLPMPGGQVVPLHKTQRPLAPERPVAVGEGQELVQPSTGKVITPARPKTFAPRQPSASDKKAATQGKAETYADAILKQFNGDADKAIAAVEGLKSLDPSMKAEVRKLIRDIKKPSPKKQSAFDRYMSQHPELQQRLKQAPAQ